MSPARRVALLGGSFNPPHVGHLTAAVYVHATREVDEVWLMPAYRHPFGKPLAAFEHRLAMCEALARESSGWLKVTDCERHVGLDGRTVDTLTYLLPQHPDLRFTLIIGSDILGDLPNWKDFDRVRAMADVLVLQRAGFPAREAVGPALVEVSSSQVRALFAAGDDPTPWVPREVVAYAKAHGLYQG